MPKHGRKGVGNARERLRHIPESPTESVSDVTDVSIDPGSGHLPRRFVRRSLSGGPACWADVDERELQEECNHLLRSINGVSQEKGTGILETIFKEARENSEVLDPLGFGAIDVGAGTLLVLQHPRCNTLAEQVTPGRARQKHEVDQLVITKWHRERDSEGSRASDASKAAPGSSIAGRAMGLPPDLAELLPTEEAFSPQAYLGTFHKDVGEAALRRGAKALGSELNERTHQLKQLIRDNFERFASCQSTLEDVYAKLRKAEGMGPLAAAPAAKAMSSTASGAGSSKTGHKASKGAPGRDADGTASGAGGPEGLQLALESVQQAAGRALGEVLERAARSARIRSVSALLKRFNNLFGMPTRIQALAAEGNLTQVVAEYKRANALLRPSCSASRVWSTLYQEVEQRVLAVYSDAQCALEDPGLGPEEAPDYLILLAQLTAEKLPGTHQQDPFMSYLTTVERALRDKMAACDAKLLSRLASLRSQLAQEPNAMKAALQLATAWQQQGPAALLALRAGHSSWAAPDSLPGLLEGASSAPGLHAAYPGHLATNSAAAAAAAARQAGRDTDPVVQIAPAPLTPTFPLKASSAPYSMQDQASDSAPHTGQAAGGAGVRTKGAPGGALPTVPSSLADLALLLW
ncbi:exocyst complex component Sec5-domain-containing protein, partial [Haematococcus lacustris]